MIRIIWCVCGVLAFALLFLQFANLVSRCRWPEPRITAVPCNCPQTNLSLTAPLPFAGRLSRGNTGIETAIDRIGPEWHDLSKRAKDMGSAAVLLSLMLCAATWLLAALYRFVL